MGGSPLGTALRGLGIRGKSMQRIWDIGHHHARPWNPVPQPQL
jgi:hypothetical protein